MHVQYVILMNTTPKPITKINKPMAQQTAVEWIIQQLPPGYRNNRAWGKIIKQAKQMEKEQRINAQMDMFHRMDKSYYGLDYLNKREEAEKYAEQYYTQTYGTRLQNETK